MNKKNVVFISSAGGHLTELLKLSFLFNKYNYVLITEKNNISLKLKEKYNLAFLFYGSRFYPLKYLFISFLNFFINIFYFIKYNPDLIYTTGAHTCVVMCYLAKLFRRKIIYVEVFDRIEFPTLTSRLIYPIADLFFVQHRELLTFFPRAKYIGGIY